MSINSFFYPLLFLSLFSFLIFPSDPLPLPDIPSPYFSPTIIFPNYQKMLRALRIFIYTPNTDLTFTSPAESHFYSSLIKSPFVTQNGDEAHLFFVPFPSDLSPRSLSRLIRNLRIELPYWNRTLGADHFFLSCSGIDFTSDRNIVELKKNSVQISCFPATDGKFIPHKDITLPPLVTPQAVQAPVNVTERFLGYVKHGWIKESNLVNELINDQGFLIESALSDQMTYTERISGSNFCLFEYKGGDVSDICEALRFGCIPVVITDRPIQDLPFMDVLRWQEMTVILSRKGGAGELKRVLRGIGGDRLEQMRGLGVTAGKHFVWNESPEPFDSFNTVMYQLWQRRHTIRYAWRESDH